MDETPGAHPHILIVEDDPGYQRLLELAVRRMGCQVECCFDGKAALRYVASHPCDLMFIDIHIPELDGFMVACQLREMGFKLPLIAISALKLEGIERKAKAVGFDEFLAKPIAQSQLERMLTAFGYKPNTVD